MIRITDDIAIDEKEISFQFIRASGPGGQNVNKVATAVQLRFDVTRSNLPEDIVRRLMSIARRKITKDGILIIEAKRHRSQEQNRQDALDRLVKLIQKAAYKPKRRKPTRPSRAAKEKRLEEKKRQGHRKKTRKTIREFDE